MGVLFLDPLDDQLKILDPGYLSFPVPPPCSVKPRLFGSLQSLPRLRGSALRQRNREDKR